MNHFTPIDVKRAEQAKQAARMAALVPGLGELQALRELQMRALMRGSR